MRVFFLIRLRDRSVLGLRINFFSLGLYFLSWSILGLRVNFFDLGLYFLCLSCSFLGLSCVFGL